MGLCHACAGSQQGLTARPIVTHQQASMPGPYVALTMPLQSLTFLWTLQLTKFAVLYSIGSVLSLAR